MSGITGVFRRDGRPADRSIVETMMRAAPHRGPDGAFCWAGGPLALGHQLLSTDPDDLPLLAQPLFDPALGAAITFDGRIDNRADVVSGLRANDHSSASDARLVMAAYAAWGEDCAVRLVGDFAFAVWDAVGRTLFCARDAMGIKPFYYTADAAVFGFGSELRQVLAMPSVRRTPNEGMIAEYLSGSIQSSDETLFTGVMRLPPAHTLTVTPTTLRIRRYWQLDPAADVVCRDDAEYAEQFRERFRRAVSRRLRGQRTAFFLSGGIDSSSVVVAAAGLGTSIEAWSMVFPGQTGLDESRYIGDVVRASGAVSHTLVSPAADGETIRRNITRRRDVADLPCDAINEVVLRSMRERGMRVALSGHGGDHAFEGSIYHYADLMRAGRFVGLARQIWADARSGGGEWSVWDPVMCGVRPLLPPSWRRAVRPIARRIGLVPSTGQWIAPEFAARAELDDRLRRHLPAEGPSFGRRAALANYAGGWLAQINEATDCRAAEHGLEERHPFLDRELVEFAVAIPESQRWQGRETKYVVRRAMRGLPESVRRRTDKADFTPCVMQAFEALGGRSALRRLRIAEEGWVSQPGVEALCREAERQQTARHSGLSGSLFTLWTIACLDYWYRLVFPKGSADDRLETGARDFSRPGRFEAEEASVSPA